MNCLYLGRYNTCQMFGICIDNGKTFRRSSRPFACFHKAFAFINDNPGCIYRISYKLRIKKRCDGQRNNFALLNKINMCRLLNSFKQIIPFTYHFEDIKSSYIVCLELEGTGLQHKGLLMLSRSLFEYPHNCVGFDILKMRDIGTIKGIDFTKISLYNLYLIGIASMHGTGDECFIGRDDVKLIPASELKNKLKDINNGRISLVMPYDNTRRWHCSRIENTDELNDNAKFKRRVAVYIKNYIASLE